MSQKANPININQVRRALNKHGIPFATKSTHTAIKGGWTSIRRSGVRLKTETTYEAKQHIPTGNVEVHVLTTSAGGHEQNIIAAKAIEALEAERYIVRGSSYSHLIVTGRVSA